MTSDREVLLPGRLPGVELPEVGDLQEVETMLSERVSEWTEQWKQQGLEEGRQQGRATGFVESARGTVVLDAQKRRLNERKFGQWSELPKGGRRLWYRSGRLGILSRP